MAKRIKTKYTGVFYRESTTNGKTDKIYYIVFKENCKTKEVKVGKLSEGIHANYANQIRMSMITKIRLGEDLPTLLKSKEEVIVITFNEISMKYFDSRELHNKTNHQSRSKYQSQLKPLIGSKDISRITKKDILSIQTELAKTRAPKTVNQYIQFIRAVYNNAIEEEIYKDTNPTRGVKELAVDNKRERFLTVDEIKSLLNAVSEQADLYLFTLLSLSTGGRLNTVLSITKKDISFENTLINLKDRKNDDTYGGFFAYQLNNILLKRVNTLKKNDKVITMHERTVRRKMSTILNKLFNQELAVKDRKSRVVIHTLRHTFASQLAINGTPIFTIQNLLNHKDIKQTLRYAKLAPDSGKDRVALLMKNFISD